VKVLIAGTGGVGGYYGARLLAAGHDVSFLARGDNLAAMRSQGLTVLSTHGDLRFEQVAAVEDGAEAGGVDAVLFCVKTYDNRTAADAVEGAVKPGTMVCSLQNGVENEPFLADRFPDATVLGGVTRLESWLDAPGVVIQRGDLADIVIGAFRRQDRRDAQALVDAFDETAVPARLSSDIVADLWTKLLIIAGIGGATAYCRCSIGEVRQDPMLLSLLTDAMTEVERVAAARDVALAPGLPDVVLENVKSSLDPRAKSSMCRDVERGRPLEVEAINGAVVRFGAEAGVPTPANQRIQDRLLPLHIAAVAAAGNGGSGVRTGDRG
jgi:2-dehydropantoate 2-reductase